MNEADRPTNQRSRADVAVAVGAILMLVAVVAGVLWQANHRPETPWECTPSSCEARGDRSFLGPWGSSGPIARLDLEHGQIIRATDGTRELDRASLEAFLEGLAWELPNGVRWADGAG